MTPKTVLYVITKANWGGAQKYVWELMTHAKDYGFEAALAYGEDGLLAERARDAGFKTYEVRGLARDISLKELSAKHELERLFKKLKPDVVHLNSSKAGFTGALAARAERVPRIIFTAHGWSFNEARPMWQRALFRFLHRETIANADVTICVSNAVKKQIEKDRILHKLAVVHNGVGDEQFFTRDEARTKLAVPRKDGFWIGMIAELHPTKRVDLAIRAVAEMESAELIVLGEGEERKKLENLAQRLGISDRVHLVGFVPEGVRYLKAFDLFLITSRTEAFAFVALEAGLAGLPVIASNVGGIPEIISNDETGLLFPSGNVEELAIAIATLMREPEHAKKLGDNLKARIARDFTLENMTAKTFALY